MRIAVAALAVVVLIGIVAAARLAKRSRHDTPLAPAVAAKPIEIGDAAEADGYRVSFALSPAPGARGPVQAGDAAMATFTVSDARTGDPARGLHPFAWMSLRERDAKPDRATCKAKVKRYLAGLVSEQADVDMNAYLLLALNEDATVTVINPQIALSRTKLQAIVTLPARGADWALAPDRERVWVTAPGADRLVAVDTAALRAAGSVETGRRPVRVAAAPDGRTVWVGNDGDDTIVAVDTRTLATVARLDVGPGHKELAFADGGRMLVATAAGSARAVLVDVATLARKGEVEVGRGVTALAASDAAAAVANGAGELVLVSTRTLSAIARAAFAPRVAALRFDSSGRWAFAAAPAAGRVGILDASSGRLRHDLDGFAAPDSFAFTASYAYVHNARSTKVSLVRLDSLGKAAPPAISDVEILQQASGQEDAGSGAPVIVPNPEGDSVTVAGGADQALYQYREGMMAPMGTHKNYGRRPRSVMVLDRSLAEVRPGVYGTTVRVREPGKFDVQFLSDRPRALACLEVTVGGTAPADHAAATMVELAPEFDPAHHLAAGGEAHLAFRASRRGGGALSGGATVLLVRMPGVWQWRGPARGLGGGRYEVAVTPPAPGQYKLLVAFEADGVPLGALDPITLGVDPAAAPSALSLAARAGPPASPPLTSGAPPPAAAPPALSLAARARPPASPPLKSGAPPPTPPPHVGASR